MDRTRLQFLRFVLSVRDCIDLNETVCIDKIANQCGSGWKIAWKIFLPNGMHPIEIVDVPQQHVDADNIAKGQADVIERRFQIAECRFGLLFDGQ